MVHTIERFAAAPSVDSIIAVVPTHYVTELGGLDVSKPIRVVSGGRTRAESVANGLNAVEGGMEIVAVISIVLPLVLGGYVLLAARARRMFKSARAVRTMNRGTGAAMACAAVAVATR